MPVVVFGAAGADERLAAVRPDLGGVREFYNLEANPEVAEELYYRLRRHGAHWRLPVAFRLDDDDDGRPIFF